MILRILKNIPKGVQTVTLSSCLIAISTSIFFSISPFYMTQVLGLSVFSMGIIEGIAEAFAQASRLGSGYISDLLKKNKPALVLGTMVATLAKPIFIFSSSAHFVVLSKVLERISNGILATPRDTYVANQAIDGQKGYYLGLLMSVKTAGITAGSFFVGLMLLVTDNYRALLIVGLIASILSLLLLICRMPKENDKKETSSEKVKISLKDVRSFPKSYWFIVVVASIFMTGRFSDGFLALRLAELGVHKSICASTIGIFNLMSVICCLPIGYLSDKFNRYYLLAVIILSLVMAHICFTSSYLSIAFSGVLLWGLQRGVSQVLFSALITDVTPKHLCGTALGTFYLITGVISIVTGFVSGYLATVSLIDAFYFGAICSALSLIVLAAGLSSNLT